jgi:hypothetical protein
LARTTSEEAIDVLALLASMALSFDDVASADELELGDREGVADAVREFLGRVPVVVAQDR